MNTTDDSDGDAVAVVGTGPTARRLAVAVATDGSDVRLAACSATDVSRTGHTEDDGSRADYSSADVSAEDDVLTDSDVAFDAPGAVRASIEVMPLESALDGASIVFEATEATEAPVGEATEAEVNVTEAEVSVTDAKRSAKAAALERIDTVAVDDAVLVTTATVPPLTDLAAVTSRPERVVGASLSSPPLDLVELGCGAETSDDAVATLCTLFEAAGVEPIVVDGDVPGSVGDRLELRFRLEAIRQVEGLADPEAFDAAVRRLGFPQGPLEGADREGLADLEARVRALESHGVAIHAPELLSRLVDVGSLGVETDEGFHEYEGDGTELRIPREKRYEADPWPLFAPVVNEAAWLLERDVATREAIDAVLERGANWPRGLLSIADEYGLDRVLERLEEAHAETGWAEYDPNPALLNLVEEGAVGLAAGAGFYEHEHDARTFETVRYERRAFFAVITLDRPHVLNALDEASWIGLRRALEHADADDGVRATILRGAGRAFSAGDDIAEMYAWEADEEATTFFREVLGPTVEALRRHSKPTIAVIDGIATGGGCELVTVCDLAVTTPESEFGLPEALIGAIPPIAPAYGLTSLRKKDFMELAFTGDRLSGIEASERGLVNYVVDADQVEDVARELARATTAASPASTAAIKRGWNRSETEFHESLFEGYLDAVAERVQSDDGQEGMGAFLEKRDPEWVR